MKDITRILNKTTAGTVIAYMWIIASVLMFFGIGNVSDSALEKVFSIDMLIMGYFYTRKPDKEDNPDNQVTTKTKEITMSTPIE